MTDRTAAPRQSDRAFGLTFAVLFALIAGIARWGFDAELVWAVVTSGAFLVLALLFPGVLLPLNRLWTALVQRLGRLNNHLLLGLFFFLFVWPVALIIRVLGRDTLGRRFDTAAESYWSPVERKPDPESFRDMF